jgi:hypothetical protein
MAPGRPGAEGVGSTRWRTERRRRAWIRRARRTSGRGHRAGGRPGPRWGRGLPNGTFPDGPADNREVVGSNPTGPISRQRIAPFRKHRLPLGFRNQGSHGRPDMGVENRESLSHLLLPDPDVVQGLIDGDVPENPLSRRPPPHRCRFAGAPSAPPPPTSPESPRGSSPPQVDPGEAPSQRPPRLRQRGPRRRSPRRRARSRRPQGCPPRRAEGSPSGL